jgi:hypothetical protein
VEFQTFDVKAASSGAAIFIRESRYASRFKVQGSRFEVCGSMLDNFGLKTV